MVEYEKAFNLAVDTLLDVIENNLAKRRTNQRVFNFDRLVNWDFVCG